MMNMTADDTKSRFLSEQLYIQRYIDFLRTNSQVTYSKLEEIVSPLEKAGVLIDFKVEPDDENDFMTCSLPELKKFVNAYHEAVPGINEKKESLSQRIKMCEKKSDLETARDKNRLKEIIDFCRRNLSINPSEEDIEFISYMIKYHDEVTAAEYGEYEGEYRELSNQEIDHCIKESIYLNLLELDSELWLSEHYFKDVEICCRVLQSDAEINTFRQGFILISTAFDAAVFDLMRVALSRDFFGLIPAFGSGSKKNISLESLSGYSNFSSFRDSVIEEQLKSRYLKDILFMLEKLGVICVDESNGERFVELTEIVMRRNLHVHNRGIVDERYLERRSDGTPSYNIYNFQVGDLAKINRAYWEKSNNLCRHCVEKLADWANSLG